jgi:hypothetical protein
MRIGHFWWGVLCVAVGLFALLGHPSANAEIVGSIFLLTGTVSIGVYSLLDAFNDWQDEQLDERANTDREDEEA